jgi:hypothetical protein
MSAMKKLVSNALVFIVGLFMGWLSFLLFHSVNGSYGYDTYGIYQDLQSTLNTKDLEIAAWFGFEAQNEGVAERIAATNAIWSAQSEKCKTDPPSKILYVMRSIVWGQADKFAARQANAKSTGVSDLAHFTRRQVAAENLDCAIALRDAVAFIVAESQLASLPDQTNFDLTKPLAGQLNLIDQSLLANVDAWLSEYPVGPPCRDLRDPNYFQCNGTPGVLFAYRAALLSSVVCSKGKRDRDAILKVEAAWDLAITRSAAINSVQYNRARGMSVDAIRRKVCAKNVFWLTPFEY